MSVNKYLVNWLKDIDPSADVDPILNRIDKNEQDADISLNPAVTIEDLLFDLLFEVATAKLNGDERVTYKVGRFNQLLNYIAWLLEEKKFGFSTASVRRQRGAVFSSCPL
jgi:hypothetical protein